MGSSRPKRCSSRATSRQHQALMEQQVARRRKWKEKRLLSCNHSNSKSSCYRWRQLTSRQLWRRVKRWLLATRFLKISNNYLVNSNTLNFRIAGTPLPRRRYLRISHHLPKPAANAALMSKRTTSRILKSIRITANSNSLVGEGLWQPSHLNRLPRGGRHDS